MVNSATNKSPVVLLNGRSLPIDRNVHATLLDFLRDQGLTGTKEGCAEGECGACTVVMLEDHAGGCAYRAVNSCLMLAPMAADREIYTVEALAARGELSEVQKAMAEAGGSQCGYCTPGFVMSMFAEQYRPGRVGASPAPEELGVCTVLTSADLPGENDTGSGWMTIEELLWDAQGRVATAGASTYKLPSWSEVPPVFHVNFLERAAEPGVVFGSKAVGEPQLMLAIPVRHAILDAVAAFGKGGHLRLAVPATRERVFFAVRRARQESPAGVGKEQGALRP